MWVSRGSISYSLSVLALFKDLLCGPSTEVAEAGKTAAADEDDEEAAWRSGPAKLWYDRMGVGRNPRSFDYGFTLQKAWSPSILSYFI